MGAKTDAFIEAQAKQAEAMQSMAANIATLTEAVAGKGSTQQATQSSPENINNENLNNTVKSFNIAVLDLGRKIEIFTQLSRLKDESDKNADFRQKQNIEILMHSLGPNADPAIKEELEAKQEDLLKGKGISKSLTYRELSFDTKKERQRIKQKELAQQAEIDTIQTNRDFFATRKKFMLGAKFKSGTPEAQIDFKQRYLDIVSTPTSQMDNKSKQRELDLLMASFQGKGKDPQQEKSLSWQAKIFNLLSKSLGASGALAGELASIKGGTPSFKLDKERVYQDEKGNWRTDGGWGRRTGASIGGALIGGAGGAALGANIGGAVASVIGPAVMALGGNLVAARNFSMNYGMDARQAEVLEKSLSLQNADVVRGLEHVGTNIFGDKDALINAMKGSNESLRTYDSIGDFAILGSLGVSVTREDMIKDRAGATLQMIKDLKAAGYDQYDLSKMWANPTVDKYLGGLDLTHLMSLSTAELDREFKQGKVLGAGVAGQADRARGRTDLEASYAAMGRAAEGAAFQLEVFSRQLTTLTGYKTLAAIDDTITGGKDKKQWWNPANWNTGGANLGPSAGVYSFDDKKQDVNVNVEIKSNDPNTTATITADKQMQGNAVRNR